MDVTTSAFTAGGDIPARFTCDGTDAAPPLRWSDPPAGTKSLALVVDDPDAPGQTWVHWLLFDLPETERELAEGTPPKRELPSGARQGVNDFGRIGYGGPCPPHGPPHRYYFRLYALDTRLGLRAGTAREELDKAMRGHILAEAEMMGRYRRP